MSGTFGSGQVCEMVGITYRMLDNWCLNGVVDAPPVMPRNRREFTADQVRVLRIVARVSDMAQLLCGVGGASIPLLVLVAESLRRNPDAKWLTISSPTRGPVVREWFSARVPVVNSYTWLVVEVAP